MVEATTAASKTEGPGLSETIGAKKDAAKKSGPQPPHIVLRVLIGMAGLSLLVGFLMPWVNDPATAAGTEIRYSGWEVALGRAADIPANQALWALPALGLVLSVAGFMGFRWAGQLAIAFGAAILSFALYVVLRIFVDRTEFGLWTVAGGTFIVLLLGVIAWMVESRRKVTKADATKSTPAKSPAAD